MRFWHVIGLLIFASYGCVAPKAIQHNFAPGAKAKNIILMIGDGMGLTQISAALYANNNSFVLEKFPVVGLHKSYSSSDLITDSAAGATAFACGVKTYNSAIGLKKDTTPCFTIIEEAETKGLATGLVATSTIVHATPASFAAHQMYRILHEEIAADLASSNVDLLIGGGQQYFEERSIDHRNLIDEMIQMGYQVESFHHRSINELTINPKKNFVYFTESKHPGTVATGRNYLPFASKLAVRYLSRRGDENGFFAMIEGSQIDWACHSNDGKLTIKETIDFGNAIEEVLNFAMQDGNTLVIVTADHETGGMAIQEGSSFKKIISEFNTNGHTATLIPVFAYGPSAELFRGVYENTAIYEKMRQALGWKKMPAENGH